MSCFGAATLKVREQGRLYTLSCVLPGTYKNLTDKMKPISPPPGTSVLNMASRLMICKDELW